MGTSFFQYFDYIPSKISIALLFLLYSRFCFVWKIPGLLNWSGIFIIYSSLWFIRIACICNKKPQAIVDYLLKMVPIHVN